MKEKIIQITLELAAEHGLLNLSRKMVCDAAGIPVGSFTYRMECDFSEFIESLDAELGEEMPRLRRRAMPALRREQLINLAMDLAHQYGYTNVTRQGLAVEANVSASLVNRYFGNTDTLRKLIMQTAISRKDKKIIAQGLAIGDKRALAAPEKLKNSAIESLT